MAEPRHTRIRRRAQHACEYCRLPQRASILPHQIDHIIAQQHMGSDVENNLCLRCLRCNLKKGPNIASIDPAVESEYRLVALFHPRKQRWSEHFHLREDGHIEGVTPEGRATVRLLDFNAELDFIHLVIEQCQQTPSAVIYETSFWRSIRNRDIQKLPLFENQELMPDGSSVLRAWIKSS